MNISEHLLSVLAEESCEVGQRVSKALRFGLGEIQPGQELTNAERIAVEVTDFLAVLEMLDEAGIFSAQRDPDAIERKKAKVVKFMDYAMECGALVGATELAAAPTLPSVQEVPTDPYAEVTLANLKAGKLTAARIYVAYCELSQELKAANGAIERYAAQTTSVQALPDIVPYQKKLVASQAKDRHTARAELRFALAELSDYRALFAQLKGQK